LLSKVLSNKKAPGGSASIMIITLVFITGAPGLYVKQIYHNVEIACKELLFALSRKEGIHNTVSYMIYLPKHHLDLVDDMYDRFPNKKYISPKISFVRRWGIRKKATGGKKCLRLQKIIRTILNYSSILFCLMCW
jgi:hypothetical protein